MSEDLNTVSCIRTLRMAMLQQAPAASAPSILAAEDESIILNGFMQMIENKLRNAQVYRFQKAEQAYLPVLGNRADIEPCDVSGVIRIPLMPDHFSVPVLVIQKETAI